MVGTPLSWFIRNPIAANLLMVLLIIGGFMTVPSLDKQFFPTPEINQVSVTMPFPGAGPAEVEEQICIRVEEAIHDLTGIKEIRSIAQQGMGTILIEATQDYPVQRLTADIKTRVDAIDTFPSDAERPVVTELTYRHLMAVVALAGDLDAYELKELGETLRDELARQPYVSVVDLQTTKPYEVSVDISEATLRRYGLSFENVVSAIQGASLNLPAGAIKSREGDVRVQTRGQAYNRADFERIVLFTKRDGTELLLGDVADIRDGFADWDLSVSFDGRPSLEMYVYVTANPDVLRTSETIRQWVAKRQPSLPPGVELSVWRDSAKDFSGRVDTLLKNGIGGLLLVGIVLVLFLRPKLAFWVGTGIAVAFLGTLFMVKYTGVSLNMVSLFAFLLVLGIVVDDAIIVGEAIHTHQTRGEFGERGALLGVHSVVKPVMFAVISTMVFFFPMMMMPGEWAVAARAIPVVVILALAFSLVECLLILPAHLAHLGPEKPAKNPLMRRLEQWRRVCAEGMLNFARYRYRPFLARSLNQHYLVGAIFFVAFVFSIALYGGGWLKTAFFPRVNSDYVYATVEMPEGGPYAVTKLLRDRMLASAEELKLEWNERDEFQETPAVSHVSAVSEANRITMVIGTVSEDVDTEELARDFRERVGPVPEAKSIRMDFTIRDPGKPIKLVLASRSTEELIGVVPDVRRALASYPGVFDVSDSFDSARDEVVLELKPAAEGLGITLAHVARQVRQAFYGAEAQRIPRGREDVKVMVRYPESERRSIGNLDDMYIRTPTGAEVPFETVASYRIEPGYQKLERLDRMRTLEVEADVSWDGATPLEVVTAVIEDWLPQWQQRYPGLQLKLDGELQEEAEFQRAMLKYMVLAMLVIFGLMAIAFRSYWQPFLVLTAIPFGIMGAIFGHALLNWQISIFSMMGVIACAGVVVNDNLVLIDRVNTLRGEGLTLREAVLQAGEDRFRPIILTSLTTFVGLLPIMSETSVQAQFLIPMVTSLAFGVLFATGVTLVLVPSLYLIGEDVAELFDRLKASGKPRALSLSK
ncbi:MAG: efflux RND transporter permease subunit [Luminiphilus sp.]